MEELLLSRPKSNSNRSSAPTDMSECRAGSTRRKLRQG